MTEPPRPSDTFCKDVHEAVLREASAEELVQIVRAHKSNGLTQSTAIAELQALRSRVTDPQEDRILELMDCVSGWCAPQWRIYPENDDET